jgi:hypothetical protein
LLKPLNCLLPCAIILAWGQIKSSPVVVSSESEGDSRALLKVYIDKFFEKRENNKN